MNSLYNEAARRADSRDGLVNQRVLVALCAASDNILGFPCHDQARGAENGEVITWKKSMRIMAQRGLGIG